MKIYNVIGKTQTKELIDEQTKEVLIPSNTIYKLEVNKEALNLLKTTGGGTAARTRYLILNLWNYSQYPLNDFDMFGVIRNADTNFGELIISIFEMCNFQGDACFHILDEIAPLFQDEFYSKYEMSLKDEQ